VVIRSTAGSGSVMIFDAGSNANGYRSRMIGDFWLDATNAAVATGLYTRNVHHSKFECSVRNVSYSACTVEGAVLNAYKVACTAAGGAMSVVPQYGIRVDGSSIVSATTDCQFDLIIESALQDGVVLIKACNSIFTGTSEGLGGKGITIAANSTGNLFHAFFLEANSVGGDIDCYGSGNRFVNCSANSAAPSSPYDAVKSITIRTGAVRNVWEGGKFYAALVEAGALNNAFLNFDSRYVVTDNGSSTSVYGLQLYYSLVARAAQIPIQEPWATLSTIGSWTNTSSIYQPAQYAINRSSREVLLRGEVGLGIAGSVIATLPASHRPTKQFSFLCPSNTTQNYATVSVAPSGDVRHVAGYTTSIDLGAVRFFI
jgi:hypothetical protein